MKRTLWLKALQVLGDIDRTLGISPSPREEQKNRLPACTCSLLLGAASSSIPCHPVVWVGATNHGIHPYSYTSDHMTQVQPIRNFPWEFLFGTNREKPILWRQHHELSSSKLSWGWWTFPTLWERAIWVAGGRANPSREAEVRKEVVGVVRRHWNPGCGHSCTPSTPLYFPWFGHVTQDALLFVWLPQVGIPELGGPVVLGDSTCIDSDLTEYIGSLVGGDGTCWEGPCPAKVVLSHRSGRDTQERRQCWGRCTAQQKQQKVRGGWKWAQNWADLLVKSIIHTYNRCSLVFFLFPLAFTPRAFSLKIKYDLRTWFLMTT